MRFGTRTVPTEYFVLSVSRGENGRCHEGGAAVGYINGHPIIDTVVDDAGRCYRYMGLAPRLRDGRLNVLSLRPGEWIVEPGLVYAADAPVGQRGKR